MLKSIAGERIHNLEKSDVALCTSIFVSTVFDIPQSRQVSNDNSERCRLYSVLTPVKQKAAVSATAHKKELEADEMCQTEGNDAKESPKS